MGIHANKTLCEIRNYYYIFLKFLKTHFVERDFDFNLNLKKFIHPPPPAQFYRSLYIFLNGTLHLSEVNDYLAKTELGPNQLWRKKRPHFDLTA